MHEESNFVNFLCGLVLGHTAVSGLESKALFIQESINWWIAMDASDKIHLESYLEEGAHHFSTEKAYRPCV